VPRSIGNLVAIRSLCAAFARILRDIEAIEPKSRPYPLAAILLVRPG